MPSTSLLPDSQTPLEAALVLSSATPAQTVAAVDIAPTLYDADAIPEHMLPWLAWSRDVLYWDPASPIGERRRVAAESFDLHRRVGTLSAYKRLARYGGFAVIDARRPPDKTYLGAALTTAQRNAWLRQFPQLRIYPFRSNGIAAGSHCGSTYPNGAAWPATGDAVVRIGERVYLYRDGIESPLVSADVQWQTQAQQYTSAKEARIPGSAGAATWLGTFARYTADNGASNRLYRVAETGVYDEPTATLRITAARPSLEPINVHYDAIALSGTARVDTGIFLACTRAINTTSCAGYGFCAGFAASQVAGERIYRRLYLFDPSGTTPTRGRTTHLDATRLGLPAYHARLRVDLRRKWSGRVALCGRTLGRHPSAMRSASRISFARETLQPAMSARDRISINTRTHAPLAASNRLFASDALHAGDYYPEVY